MKPCFIIFIILFGLLNSAWGQSAQASIDSLIKYKVITAQERPILEKEIKDRKGVSYRVAILGGLDDVLLTKRISYRPP